MSQRIQLALNNAMLAIQSQTPAMGMRNLLAFLGAEEPGDPSWKKLAVIDFARDSVCIRNHLQSILSTGAVDAYSHFYFGLDCLNMPTGKGIEFGCGKGENYSFYPGDVPSPALGKIFSTVGYNFAQYTLGIGYLGLALKYAFSTLDGKLAQGSTKKRHITFGFHDGDLFRLGKISARQFLLQLDPADLAITNLSKVPPTSLSNIWPRRRASTADWFFAASRASLLISDPSERINRATGHMNKLCEHAQPAKARKLLPALLATELTANKVEVGVELHLCAARIAFSLKHPVDAESHLKMASQFADRIEREYWRTKAHDKIFHLMSEFDSIFSWLAVTPQQKWNIAFRKAFDAAVRSLERKSKRSTSSALKKLDAVINIHAGHLRESNCIQLRGLYKSAGDHRRLEHLRQMPKSQGNFLFKLMDEQDKAALSEEADIVKAAANQFTVVEQEQREGHPGFVFVLTCKVESAVKKLKRKDPAAMRQMVQRIFAILSIWCKRESKPADESILAFIVTFFPRMGMKREAMQLLGHCDASIAKIKEASSRDNCFARVATAYGRLKARKQADQCADKISNAHERRIAHARLLLRANRWSKLHALLTKVNEPNVASELAMRLAWATDRPNS